MESTEYEVCLLHGVVVEQYEFEFDVYQSPYALHHVFPFHLIRLFSVYPFKGTT
jgi:hypothetical protein